MKKKKWVAILLLTSQLLTSLPISAAASDQKSSTDLITESIPSDVDSSQESESIKEPAPENESIPDELPPEILPEPKPPESEKNIETEAPEAENLPEQIIQPQPPKESDKLPVLSPESDNSSNGTRKQPEQPTFSETLESAAEAINETSTTFQVSPVQETWDFIKEIGEDARQVGQENDLYASVMIAQAILESASGQSQLSQAPYFNLFGIKGRFNNNGVTFKTQEDDGTGNLYTVEATFRQYSSIEESFQDYAALLKNGLSYDQEFYRGAWKTETNSYKDATEFLTSRYATDKHYNEKLDALIEAYALVHYDSPKIDPSEENQAYVYPVDVPVISSYFGPRWGSFHRGVDFAAPTGTPIYASQSGIVLRSEFHDSWGNYIAIQHPDGLTTLYAHNSQNLVSVGQSVSQGELIASMGSTGNSTGPHLHFEVSRSPNLAQDQLVDPLTILGN